MISSIQYSAIFRYVTELTGLPSIKKSMKLPKFFVRYNQDYACCLDMNCRTTVNNAKKN
jgi:hypothetical protein